METRTAAEVIAYEPPDGESMFGFDREALALFLTFEEAQPWRKADADPAKWGEVKPRTREAILAELTDYMTRVGLDKAVNHRGLSANRTIEKLRALCWLMNDEEAVRLCDDEPYQNYGAPKLLALCEYFGIDWRAALGGGTDEAIFEAQAKGEVCPACLAGDESGCGS